MALIGLIAFVDALGFAITLPVFPLYAKDELAASAAQITGVQAAYFAMSFIVGPILGRLSDRHGRRPILIVSQLGSLLSYVLIAFAPTIWIVYLARMLDGITAGNFSTAQAYISDITEPRERARRLGTTALAFSLGLSIGPAIGGFVAGRFGPRAAYLVGATIGLATIVLTALLLKESLSPEKRALAQAARARTGGGFLSLVRVPAVAILLVVAFFAQFSFFSFQTVYVLWAQKVVFPTESSAHVSEIVSYVLAFVGLCGIVVQLRMIGPLVRRFGEKSMLIAGLTSRTLFFSLLVAFPVALMLPAAAPLLAFGTGMTLPNLAALQTYAAPADRRGQILGTNQSAASLGSVLAPLIGGQLFERVAPGAPIALAMMLSAIALAVALLITRLHIERPAAPSPAR
jgi:DHA1 family tetracycline resistance protein-like MFS transporter